MEKKELQSRIAEIQKTFGLPTTPGPYRFACELLNLSEYSADISIDKLREIETSCVNLAAAVHELMLDMGGKAD